MKSKVLIIMPYLECGGVESTLLSLLGVLDAKRVEITLLLLEERGTFIEKVPSHIQIKTINIPEKEQGIFMGKKKMLLSYLKSGKIWKIPKFILYNYNKKLSEDRASNAKYFHQISASIPLLEEEYDLAIDYFGYATFTTFYLAEKVKAKKKVTWLHSIFSRFQPQAFEEWYKKMDVIFACSQMVKKDFESIFPTIQTVKVFYNIINPQLIRKKADFSGGFEDQFSGIRILTVGRICHEKGIDIAAQAYNLLKNAGYNIRWYIMGNGSDIEKENVIKKVNPLNRADFIFLGIKENPYVYMKQCDIYVQPSRFEGYCTTTNEARILGCPIVMTDVSGAEEQLENGKTGLIVEKESSAIYDAVKQFIEYPDFRKKVKENLKSIESDTRQEVRKIYELLEG
mgnify:FL=1